MDGLHPTCLIMAGGVPSWPGNAHGWAGRFGPEDDWGALWYLYRGWRGPSRDALADPIGTHRVSGVGALLCGGSLVAAGAVGTVWEADVTLGVGFGLGLAICYTPAVAAVQPWFDRNRGVASGIALSGTGLGTLLMPLLARWLIEDEGWRVALILIGLGVAGFGFLASNWIRRPSGLPPTSSSPPALFASSSATRGFGGSTWAGSCRLSCSSSRSFI